MNYKDDNLTSSFSVRKIPVNNNEIKEENYNNKYSDRIKILELNNYIDEWEKELLFADNGYFSLKGKEVENKAKEYIEELENFINSKINNMSFSKKDAYETAQQIKLLKIDNIKSRLLNYEAQELFEWEIDVYEKSIELSVQKAVLYKDNPKIIASCYKNGTSVLELMAERENWNSKILKSKKEKYESDFYYALTTAFLEEKNINFVLYFEKYKEKLKEEKKVELEKIISEMKNKIIAYNWAKELFSYNLNESENEKEINKIKDKELLYEVRKFISVLKNNKKKHEEEEEKAKAEKCWENILSYIDTEPEKALLYIDLSQKAENIKSQREYIKRIIKSGEIITDKSKYIDVIKQAFTDFEEFKKKNIFEYRHLFSKEDFEIIKSIQQLTNEEIIILSSDIKLLFEKTNDLKINKKEELYSIIKIYLHFLKEYKTENKKEADIEKRNKIIASMVERISVKNDKEKGSKEK